jgi:hypothetical protein
MVDPLFVTANVINILKTCFDTIQMTDHLLKRYKNTPAKLLSLHIESRLVSSSLTRVQALFHKNDKLAKSLDSNPELKITVDNTLMGFMAIYKLLDKDLQRLKVPGGDEVLVDWKKRSYMLFNEELIEHYLNQLRSHFDGLTLLLNCLQLSVSFPSKQ